MSIVDYKWNAYVHRMAERLFIILEQTDIDFERTNRKYTFVRSFGTDKFKMIREKANSNSSLVAGCH